MIHVSGFTSSLPGCGSGGNKSKLKKKAEKKCKKSEKNLGACGVTCKAPAGNKFNTWLGGGSFRLCLIVLQFLQYSQL